MMDEALATLALMTILSPIFMIATSEIKRAIASRRLWKGKYR